MRYRTMGSGPVFACLVTCYWVDWDGGQLRRFRFKRGCSLSEISRVHNGVLAAPRTDATGGATVE